MWSRSAIGAAAASGALLVSVTGLALAGSGGGSPAAVKPPAAQSTPGPIQSAPPAVLSSCWMPGPAGDVTITTAQAQDLTTRAARGLRRGQSPADFADRVQRSLGGAAQPALHVARGLMGVPDADRLTCSSSRADVQPEKMGPSGLTPRAARLRRAWTDVFGALPAGGFARGGLSRGHVDNSAHYEGRAIDVFFRPLESAAQRRKGWVFAQWVVAHAEQLHVLSVIYADHIWTSWGASMGFRDYQHPGGPTKNPVLRHLEHVHVAVESGRPFRAR